MSEYRYNLLILKFNTQLYLHDFYGHDPNVKWTIVAPCYNIEMGQIEKYRVCNKHHGSFPIFDYEIDYKKSNID